MFSLSNLPSTEALERSSRKKLSGDWIEPVQLSWKGEDENRRNLRNGQPAFARIGVAGDQ